MHGFYLLFLISYVSIKWETIAASKVFIQCDGLACGG